MNQAVGALRVRSGLPQALGRRSQKTGLSVELNLLVYANFTAHQLQHAEVLEAVRPFFPDVCVNLGRYEPVVRVFARRQQPSGRIEGWGIIFTPRSLPDEAGWKKIRHQATLDFARAEVL